MVLRRIVNFQPLKEKNGSLVNTLSFYANLLRDLTPSISAAVLHFCVLKKYMDATVASSLFPRCSRTDNNKKL